MSCLLCCLRPYGMRGEWSTGLTSVHTCFGAVYACGCAPVVLHDVAEDLTATQAMGPMEQRDAIRHNLDQCNAAFLACVLDIPVCICVDQYSTRAVDRLADSLVAPTAAAPEERASAPRAWRGYFDYILTNVTDRFGEEPRHWANDGVGWSLSACGARSARVAPPAPPKSESTIVWFIVIFLRRTLVRKRKRAYRARPRLYWRNVAGAM